jgi:adenosine deaminase
MMGTLMSGDELRAVAEPHKPLRKLGWQKALGLRALAAVLAGLLALVPLAACGANPFQPDGDTATGGTGASGSAGQRQLLSDEVKVARYFDKAASNEPALIALLQEMPKGGDLHNHSSGTIDAELVLQTAIDRGLFYDRAAKTFVEAPPSEDPAGYFTAEQMQGSGDGSTLLRSEILDAISMRESGLDINQTESGHDHFFSFWARVGAAYPSTEDIYRSLFRKAVADHVSYLELMDDVSAEDVARIDEVLKDVLAEFDKDGFSWDLTVNFITTVSRNQPLDEFKAALDKALSAQYDEARRVVATTVLSPEDSYLSQRDFEAQMDAIDAAYAHYSAEYKDRPPKMTLHAGELTLDYATYESMFDRISTSLEKGHALRIDHGSSIAWDLHTYEVLKIMRDAGIGVTLCLSSNAAILDLTGERHPFTLYHDAGVRIALATDDLGIERTNLTMEYVRATQMFDLTYTDLKGLAYNSIDLAMVSKEEKEALRAALDERFATYEARIVEIIAEFDW